MLLPTTLPSATSALPDQAAPTLTASSGELVPNATIVSPTTRGVRPSTRARREAPRTSSSPPAMSSANPARKSNAVMAIRSLRPQPVFSGSSVAGLYTMLKITDAARIAATTARDANTGIL